MLGSFVALMSAFNLVCSGTTYIRDQTDPYSGPKTRDLTSTYRVDLQANRWCADECTTTIAIAKVEPNRLTLQHLDTPSDGIDSYEVTINRETGQLFSTLVFKGVEMRVVQICTVAPFGGFPPRKF